MTGERSDDHLSSGEQVVADREVLGRAEVDQLDTVVRVEHEVVGAYVAVNERLRVDVHDGGVHLAEVTSTDGLGEQAAYGLGQQVAQRAVVAQLEDEGVPTVDEMMRQNGGNVVVFETLVYRNLSTKTRHGNQVEPPQSPSTVGGI